LLVNIFTKTSDIIITCSYRLAPYLQQEVEALGLKPSEVFKTGVVVQGTMQTCILLNLNVRCASQVLFSIKRVNAFNADELYTEAFKIEWENIIPADGYFSITSNVNNPNITNNLFANVKFKDAIVDRFREKTGARPNSGSDLTGAVIHLFWRENDVEFFVDTSGETLSKHGYRKIPGKAPMLESLAASTIMASKWDRASTFVNPMCGSGTLAIEAAMLATNRVPGLYRNNYSFMHLLGYQTTDYEQAFQKIEANVKHELPFKIIATDISKDAVEISQVNAGIAGVEQLIAFTQCDFTLTDIPETNKGVVFLNPEYGDRLGVEQELEETYGAIGDFFKQKCKGYFGYIFTGNLELAKKIGLKPNRRIEFFNSKIDCRLLEYEMYEGSREKKVKE
jgi:23S rRNA G2445 N2-methylase RlmL